jgi:class 3 adenylate cyclase
MTRWTRILPRVTSRGSSRVSGRVAGSNPSLPPTELQRWAGGSRTTLAIVFTDIVGSTQLRGTLGDERMRELVHAHYSRSEQLIAKYNGRLVKTIGDGVIAVFRTAANALDFASAFHANPGSARLRIRASVHVGEMDIETNDIAGIEVHVAARMVHAIDDAEIWITDRAKSDIEGLGAREHSMLTWVRHDNQTI